MLKRHVHVPLGNQPLKQAGAHVKEPVHCNACAATSSAPSSPLPVLSSLAASESGSSSESEFEAADPEAESEPEPDDESLLLLCNVQMQAYMLTRIGIVGLIIVSINNSKCMICIMVATL